MKRIWIITAVLLMLALGGITACHFLRGGKPEVSALYSRYEHQEGVRVGFVHHFPFDDSTLVDVTTIEALDSTGWVWMQEEFDFPPLTDRQQQLVADGQDVIQTWQLVADTCHQPPATDHQQFVFLSYGHRSLCVVQTDDEKQLNSVISYQLKQLEQ